MPNSCDMIRRWLPVTLRVSLTRGFRGHIVLVVQRNRRVDGALQVVPARCSISVADKYLELHYVAPS